jgi:Secretion system C-terminal sorting domain
MKHLVTALLALTIAAPLQGLAFQWQFVKVFPDTSQAFTAGLHGVAVDPDGKIWVGPAGVMAGDTLSNGRTTAAIYVYNPDGTEAAISRIKVINTPGASDTLTALCRGMRTAPDGNIVYVGIGGFVFKIDYKTGLGIQKVNPVDPAVAAGVAPAFTDAGEMITGHVLPGNPINIFDNTFSPLGTAVASSIGFSRTLEVSKDGNDIYWCGYTNYTVYIYHSDLGTLGPYALTDSIATGMQVESSGWNKKDGWLYFSSGTVDTADYGNPPVLPPWNPLTWYAFDVSTKEVKDSIVWNQSAYPYPVTVGQNMPRPRGIDFSVTGDTAYVIAFNHSKAAMQMFRRGPTSVQPIKNGLPSRYSLAQNYPNPFNPTTEIEFSLPTAGMTTLKVYNMLGQEIATLVNEELVAGSYKTRFDATRLSSGTYIYTLVSGTQVISKKMLLVK